MKKNELEIIKEGKTGHGILIEHDGYISLDETIHNRQLKETNQFLNENIDALARVSFDSLDVNRTGKITKEQFKQGFVEFITSAGFGKPNEAFLEEYFRKFDADQSGDLDYQEYKVYMKDALDKMVEAVL